LHRPNIACKFHQKFSARYSTSILYANLITNIAQMGFSATSVTETTTLLIIISP